MKDTQYRLSHLSILLHWLIACGIIMLMTVGYYMAETDDRSLMPLHKSVGAILLIFVVLRILLRIKNGWPQPMVQVAPAERLLALTIQWVLIIGSFLFPLSGMMMSVMGGRGLNVFGMEMFAANMVDAKPVPLNPDMAGMAANMHSLLLWVVGVALLLHITGSLKGHFIRKDGALPRMLGKKVQ